jgi:hypothetical protein
MVVTTLTAGIHIPTNSISSSVSESLNECNLLKHSKTIIENNWILSFSFALPEAKARLGYGGIYLSLRLLRKLHNITLNVSMVSVSANPRLI